MTLFQRFKRKKSNNDAAYNHNNNDNDGDNSEDKQVLVHKIKVLTIGDSGVGKSSVILRFTEDRFTPHFLTTIGIDYKIKSTILEDGTRVKIQIWDTAGQERFRNITNAYYRGAQGIILVYDISDEQSFLNVRYWLGQIEKHSTAQPIVILLGNKCDLKQERQVSLERAQELANDYDIPFFETSARNSINIDQSFHVLMKEIIEKQQSKCLLQLQHENEIENGKNIKLHEKYTEKLDKLKQKMKCSGCGKQTDL